MSKICGAANGCRFSPEQDSGGCPCADLCPGYCEPCKVTTSNKTEPEYFALHDTFNTRVFRGWCYSTTTT